MHKNFVKMKNEKITNLAKAALFFLICLTSVSVYATDGYLSNGIGIRYRGMAGAGIGFHWGPISGANNPAAMVFAGKGYELNVSLFNPNRQYTVTGAPSGFPGTFGLAPGTVESSSTIFIIPTLGANWMLNDKMSLGLNIFGNGGMNTDYESPTFGADPTGVNLSQLFFAPTFSVKVLENHALGISPILAYQSFEAKGLAAFGNFSSDPAKLSNNGSDKSIGYGVRIGYLGQLTDFLSLGASFQSPMKMGAFDEYAGLFAEQGGFDIPMNWTAGVGLQFGKFGAALDFKQIYYSKIKSIGNPLLPNLQTTPLGSDGAAGFGWKDMSVVKAGVFYEVADGLTVRAGYSYGKQPIPESEVLFNILAPGVIEQHLSLGVSKSIGEGKEINFFVTRALASSVSGPNPLEAPNQQTIELKMDQWEVGLGFSF